MSSHCVNCRCLSHITETPGTIAGNTPDSSNRINNHSNKNDPCSHFRKRMEQSVVTPVSGFILGYSLCCTKYCCCHRSDDNIDNACCYCANCVGAISCCWPIYVPMIIIGFFVGLVWGTGEAIYRCSCYHCVQHDVDPIGDDAV